MAAISCLGRSGEFHPKLGRSGSVELRTKPWTAGFVSDPMSPHKGPAIAASCTLNLVPYRGRSVPGANI
jgi:hypothetical protein